jgi:hypothetical protein
MKLKRYSEVFIFEGYLIEYCVGMVITDEHVILSYSIYDNYSKIGVYDMDYILHQLSWTIESE